MHGLDSERPVVIVLERGELPKSRADLGELRLGDHQELTAWWTAKAGADQLSKTVENQKGKLSAWWTRLQRSWDEHIAEIRQNIDERRSSHASWPPKGGGRQC